MHVRLLLGPTMKRFLVLVLFTFKKRPKERERNQCFKTGKHISDTKGSLHCLSEEWSWPITKYKLCKNSLSLKYFGDKCLTLSGMKWWHSTCLERTGAWPFIPSKPKLDIKPPHRAVYTFKESFFWPGMFFWFSFLTDSNTTSWKTIGN